ncbi:MAG TPA: Gfo/Idh/MocA family oxidoreductase [Candidatus Sumerlaeota bacterium]|nr:Gfo/Idh/MocA family oxidoreductase [Candidatus Sumerlaeota bacterium]
MIHNRSSKRILSLTRRDFVKISAVASVASLLRGAASGFAAGSDTLKVGIIGTGKRGRGALMDCLNSAPGLEVVAAGDLFKDQLDGALNEWRDKAKEKFKITPETSFVGFDAYQKVLASGVDLVILTAPPGFRALHLKAAVEAGKHVFMEKPVAVDPAGVKSVIESARKAKEKNLSIVAGTQRRHQKHYLEFMKRIQDGAIGDIVAAEAYWVGDYDYYTPLDKKPEWSDMEYQCRNWNYYTWLSGDHIVEQHVHNLDIMNWATGAHPIQCLGMGGRHQRTAENCGHIFDHFSVQYEYPNNVRVTSFCRQMKNCPASRVSERVVGTKGVLYIDGSSGFIEGANPYKYEGENVNPYVQEHADLVESIRKNQALNEAERVAESSMVAVIGRMSAYTGSMVKWDWAMKASKLDLAPAKYELGPLPVEPVAMPGITKLT